MNQIRDGIDDEIRAGVEERAPRGRGSISTLTQWEGLKVFQ